MRSIRRGETGAGGAVCDFELIKISMLGDRRVADAELS